MNTRQLLIIFFKDALPTELILLINKYCEKYTKKKYNKIYNFKIKINRNDKRYETYNEII